MASRRRPSGRPPKVTASYKEAAAQALDRGPGAYGYASLDWTTAMLRRHLARRTGIRLSEKHLRNNLKRMGFVYLRSDRMLFLRPALRADRGRWVRRD